MKHANNNGKPITFISMFSGIEAASVAFGPLGWKAICFAEIEKFPSAVLAHHYPDVPNVGDMSKHDWSQYAGKVDIVCGGPPCQDFSIAGLRAGLDGARGNLSIVYMRALHAIKPRNAIVENVPGWLNDKKNAFGCFLAGLVGADDPLRTPDGKSWPNAGMVAGPLGRAAWRVLDAQYFGLAQRRRRVLVVADFGNGADPAAVLFERKGLFGNTPPSRETGKDVAPTISARTKGGGGLGTDFDLDGGLIAGALTGGNGPGGGWRIGPDEVAANHIVHAPEIARCVATREGSSQDYETTTMVAVDVAPTVRAGGNRTGGDRPYGTDVDTCDSLAVVHAIQAGALRTNPNSGPDGVGVQEGVAYTLEARAEVQAVCVTGEVAHTLKAEGADASEDGTGRGTPIVACTHEVVGTLCAEDSPHGGRGLTGLQTMLSGYIQPVSYAPDVSATIAARSSRGGGQTNSPGHNADQQVVVTSAVRRLTPVECERLQGFRDNYTRIPIKHYAQRKITKNRPADMWEKDHNGGWWLMAPDGNRYKALGNSWAVPKFLWLGKRLAEAYKRLPPYQTQQSQPQEASKLLIPANDERVHGQQENQKHAS